MGGNNFYTNAEAYAMEILQQKLMKEAQRSAQQTIMELSTLKSLLGQGQLVYCIPFGAGPLPGAPLPPLPFPPCSFPCPPHPEPQFLPPPPQDVPRPPALPPPPGAPCPPAQQATQPAHNQSVVRVNVKGPQAKLPATKPGSDECNLGKDGIEVSIDLRDYLPAEISLDVEEKSVEIKASHVDSRGCKTFARRYDLPACIILESVRCVLTHDGFLMFSAAWCKME